MYVPWIADTGLVPQGGCIVKSPAKSEIQKIFRVLPNGIKIWKYQPFGK